MYLTPLDIINACLETTGEVPLNSADEDHPYSAAIQRLIATCNLRMQAKGWWFNKEHLKLSPETASREIYVPVDVLTLDTQSAQKQYSIRGRRLYDTAKSTYKFEQDVTVAIIRLLEFTDLPYLAQDLVQSEVVVRFVESYDADVSRIQQVRMDNQEAYRACMAEHIRNVNANILHTGGTGVTNAGLVSPGFYRGLRRY